MGVRQSLAITAVMAGVYAPATRAEPAPVAAPSHAAIPAERIPALTPVQVRIGAALGSKTSKTADRFPLTLATPLMIGGKVILPAGTPGEGEVVWAKKSGGSGASGELVLAARYLEIGGRRLRLRSMHLAPVGADKIAEVNGLAIAAATTPVPISLLGFFITGKQAVVPAGTLADAKTAEDFTFSPPAAHVAPAGPQTSVSAAGAVPSQGETTK